jgi:D-alanine-D-alanine ligase
MARRTRVGVLLGGGSGERQISLASGLMIAEHLPKQRYEAVLLDPLVLMADNPKLPAALRERARALRDGNHTPEALGTGDAALPEALREQIERASAAAAPATRALALAGGERGVDVVFIALHGPWGEDGTLQGLLELVGVPFVGSGTLASALAMDKAMAKTVLGARGLPVPADVEVTRAEWKACPAAALERAGAVLPAVVKPVRQGSSIGMSLAGDAESLRDALEEALRHDSRALVEERLSGVELSVGVLGNRELQALPPIEIVPKRSFFDYRAKYDASLSDEICPARIGEALAAEVQELALAAHRALGCRGLSRTDMIADAERGVRVLEVNTMPGMTVNSLLPKAAKVAGIDFPELLDRLVRLALEPED